MKTYLGTIIIKAAQYQHLNRHKIQDKTKKCFETTGQPLGKNTEVTQHASYKNKFHKDLNVSGNGQC